MLKHPLKSSAFSLVYRKLKHRWFLLAHSAVRCKTVSNRYNFKTKPIRFGCTNTGRRNGRPSWCVVLNNCVRDIFAGEVTITFFDWLKREKKFNVRNRILKKQPTAGFRSTFNAIGRNIFLDWGRWRRWTNYGAWSSRDFYFFFFMINVPVNFAGKKNQIIRACRLNGHGVRTFACILCLVNIFRPVIIAQYVSRW